MHPQCTPTRSPSSSAKLNAKQVCSAIKQHHKGLLGNACTYWTCTQQAEVMTICSCHVQHNTEKGKIPVPDPERITIELLEAPPAK